MLLFIIQPPLAGYQILTSPTANFNSCDWNYDSFSSVTASALFIVPPAKLTPPFPICYYQALNVCLLQTAEVILLSSISMRVAGALL